MINKIKDIKGTKRSFVSILMYRLSQFIAFLVSIHIFTTITLIIALYVSTLFLFSNVDHFKDFIFDYKVHGIIVSSFFSVLAGRIINQFYDKEKDALARPFNSKIHQFLKQKYYLYTYLIFNTISLVIAISVSYRVLVFFLIYHFFIWFYSHKLSKIHVINNLTFVVLTLYPFFGVLFYYKTFSTKIFLLAIFLFLILWMLDIVKDFLTQKVDKLFGYHTMPNVLGVKYTKAFLITLFLLLMGDTFLIVDVIQGSITASYFSLSLPVALVGIIFSLIQFKNSWLILLNLLRFWVFLGIIFMLIDGMYTHFQI